MNPYNYGYGPYPYQGNPNPYPPNNFNRGMNRAVDTPRVKTPIRTPSRVALPKFTFSKFLTGTQEVISTINTAIPLYTQVKPLLSGAKGITKGLASKFLRSSKDTNKEVVINPEVITPKSNKKVKVNNTNNYTYEEDNQPHKPFF